MDNWKPAEPQPAVQAVNKSLVMPAYIAILVGFVLILIPLPGAGLLGCLIAGFCGLILGIANLVRGAVASGIIQVILAVIGTPIVYGIGWIIFVAILSVA